nr:glycine oxidase ThiO [Thermoanaerobaculia bacterium]
RDHRPAPPASAEKNDPAAAEHPTKASRAKRQAEGGPDVVVLGGGIIGLATAWELARAGLRVELLERGKVGSGATNASAGMIAPLAEAAPGDPFFEVCRQSRELWQSWQEELAEHSGVEIEYDRSGALALAWSEDDEAHLERLRTAARAAEEPAVPIPRAELGRLIPGLSEQVRKALLLPGEHRVDNVQVTLALVRAFRRAGGTVRTRREVTSVEVEPSGVLLRGEDWQLRAPRLVLAAGAWSGEIPGLPALPVRPVRGQMLRLSGAAWEFRGSVRTAHFYAVRRGASGLLVGASVEEAGFDCRTTLGGLARYFELALRYFPRLADRPVEATWAGLRPGTPDGQPILGPLGDGPVVAATGHYRTGILLAPWTARALADLILGKKPAPELAAFRAERFSD